MYRVGSSFKGGRVWFRGTLVFLVAALTAGCAAPLGIPISIPVNKTASVFEVDDARQMVTMGAAYSRFEDPTVDWGAARGLAVETCMKRHEMPQAEPKGRTRRECVQQVGSDCMGFAILGDYQCLP